MKPAQAARASAPPTEMRRTPSSASCETVRLQLFVETRTLTGFGETALTSDAISSGLLTPGAYKQSAPASANATSRSSDVRSGFGSPTSHASQRAVRTTRDVAVSEVFIDPAADGIGSASMAARADLMRSTAKSK